MFWLKNTGFPREVLKGGELKIFGLNQHCERKNNIVCIALTYNVVPFCFVLVSINKNNFFNVATKLIFGLN